MSEGAFQAIRDAHAALTAANVPLYETEASPSMSPPERIAILVRDRDEARRLHVETAHALANEQQARLLDDEEARTVAQLILYTRSSSQAYVRKAGEVLERLTQSERQKTAEEQQAQTVPTEPLELARFTIAKYGDGADKPSVRLAKEVLRLTALINTPRTDDFFEAVRIEAAHQVERWGVEHDAGKRAEDWLTLYLYLLGKATKAHFDSDGAKLLHHIVTVAAVALNWHRNLTGVSTAMRPGVGERPCPPGWFCLHETPCKGAANR